METFRARVFASATFLVAQKEDERIYPGEEKYGYGVGPNFPIADGFGAFKHKRTKVNQIMMGDVMVWFNKPNHIATIQSHDGNKVTTVESNGDDRGCKGLGSQVITVKPSGGNVWTTPSGTEVYIVSFT